MVQHASSCTVVFFCGVATKESVLPFLHPRPSRPDPAVAGPPPYRVVVSVYGGPHVQTVVNSWLATVDMRTQFLRAKGFLVWKVRIHGPRRLLNPEYQPALLRQGALKLSACT